ncbi:MAG: glutamate-1-semialdehyde-2,1-aminomutase [Phycisphaerae bacterium]|nr:glutamate-1-semialdehyde-2,1-aminomutase [Phycisphaerae bacterium]
MTEAIQTKPKRANSQRAFAGATPVMPGGVNSPVRAYQAVGGEPIVIASGSGCCVTDVDGNEYIDYVGAYGPLILGHAPQAITVALTKAIARGTAFGMPTEAETALARLIVDAVPSIDVVRMVNSGTESTMSAIRLARAATGRANIIKCTGCYHGHADSLLVQAGSGATTLGTPSSPGVPDAVTQHTLLVPFNDVDAAQAALEQPGDVAAMLLEPVAGNMGTIPPNEGYLDALRDLCDKHGALLIFDEVMTGFRVAYGGAQELFGVTPDLTCLGKVMGGGLPCAAYGGREDLMRQISPDGPVYQAGTLSGNPLAMVAGRATLDALREPGVYTSLAQHSKTLAQGLGAAAVQAGVPARCTTVNSMVCCFFTSGPVQNYNDAIQCDTNAFATFFHAMLDQGVVLPPSQFETWFVSTEHDNLMIERTLHAAKKAFRTVAQKQR